LRLCAFASPLRLCEKRVREDVSRKDAKDSQRRRGNDPPPPGTPAARPRATLASPGGAHAARLHGRVGRQAGYVEESILLRAGTSAGSRTDAEDFTASRLDGEHGLEFGTLSPQTPFPALIDRALP
jgi:hypothetical protein